MLHYTQETISFVLIGKRKMLKTWILLYCIATPPDNDEHDCYRIVLQTKQECIVKMVELKTNRSEINSAMCYEEKK